MCASGNPRRTGWREGNPAAKEARRRMTRSSPARALVALGVLALLLVACSQPAALASATASPSATARPSATPEATASPSASPEASEAEASESAEASAVEVTIEGSRFEPGELTIPAGTEVTFVNLDTFAHTATEGTGGQAVDDPVADENLDGGASATARFDEPGTYEITCRFHPTMQMTITVES